jgi:hypothetical protein
VGRGDAGFEPGTAGQQSGALPLSYHASPLSYHASPLSYHALPLSYHASPLSYHASPEIDFGTESICKQKVCKFLLIALKAASAGTNEFSKAVSTHIYEFLKSARGFVKKLLNIANIRLFSKTLL